MKYMTADQVADLIKSADKQPKKDYLVVDVRDDDFAHGNIVGALNVPSGGFLAGVDKLVKDTKDVPLVIFHCALSQVRGPKAARIYEETRKHLFPDSTSSGESNSETKYEVAVLQEGFTKFQSLYKDDPALVENHDAEYWNGPWA